MKFHNFCSDCQIRKEMSRKLSVNVAQSKIHRPSNSLVDHMQGKTFNALTGDSPKVLKVQINATDAIKNVQQPKVMLKTQLQDSQIQQKSTTPTRTTINDSHLRNSAKNLMSRGELRSQSLSGKLTGVLNRFESSSLFRKQPSLTRGPSTSSMQDRDNGLVPREISRVSSSKVLLTRDRTHEYRKPTMLNKSQSNFVGQFQTHSEKTTERVNTRESSANNRSTSALNRDARTSQSMVKKILASGRTINTKRNSLNQLQSQSYLVGVRNQTSNNRNHRNLAEPSLERAFLHEHNRVGDLRHRVEKQEVKEPNTPDNQSQSGARRITQAMKSRLLMQGSSSTSPQKRLTSFRTAQWYTRNSSQLAGHQSTLQKQVDASLVEESKVTLRNFTEETNPHMLGPTAIGSTQVPPKFGQLIGKPQIIPPKTSQSFLSQANNLRSSSNASNDVTSQVKSSRSVKSSQHVHVIVNNYMSNHSNRGITEVDKSQERNSSAQRKPIVTSKLSKYIQQSKNTPTALTSQHSESQSNHNLQSQNTGNNLQRSENNRHYSRGPQSSFSNQINVQNNRKGQHRQPRQVQAKTINTEDNQTEPNLIREAPTRDEQTIEHPEESHTSQNNSNQKQNRVPRSGRADSQSSQQRSAAKKQANQNQARSTPNSTHGKAKKAPSTNISNLTGLNIQTLGQNLHAPKVPASTKAKDQPNQLAYMSPSHNAQKPPRQSRSNSKNKYEIVPDQDNSQIQKQYLSTESKPRQSPEMHVSRHSAWQASHRKPPMKSNVSDTKKTKLYSANKAMQISPARQNRLTAQALIHSQHQEKEKLPIKLYEPTRNKQTTIQQLFHNAKNVQAQKNVQRQNQKNETLDYAASPDKRPSYSKSQATATGKNTSNSQNKSSYKKKFMASESTRTGVANRPRKSEAANRSYKSPQKKLLQSTATINALNMSYRKPQPKKANNNAVKMRNDLANISNVSAEYQSNTSQHTEVAISTSNPIPGIENDLQRRQNDIMSKIKSNIKRSEELDKIAAERKQKDQKREGTEQDQVISFTERKEAIENDFVTFQQKTATTHANTEMKTPLNLFDQIQDSSKEKHFESLEGDHIQSSSLEQILKQSETKDLTEVEKSRNFKPGQANSMGVSNLEEYHTSTLNANVDKQLNQVPQPEVVRATGSVEQQQLESRGQSQKRVTTPSDLEETFDEKDVQPISARNDVKKLLHTPVKKQKSCDYSQIQKSAELIAENTDVLLQVQQENSPQLHQINPPDLLEKQIKVEDPVNKSEEPSIEIIQEKNEPVLEVQTESKPSEPVQVTSFEQAEKIEQKPDMPDVLKTVKKERPALPLDKKQFLQEYDELLFDTEKAELLQSDYETVYYAGDILEREPLHDEEKKFEIEFDDQDGYYEFILNGHVKYRYEVLKMLGKGSFAQVVCVLDHKTGDKYALKMNRNTELDHKFAEAEANMLKLLMQDDPNDQVNIVRMFEHSTFRNHQCFFFELLHFDLFEFLKENEFSGFQEETILEYTKQILKCLEFLEERSIIHCDLKPENIVLSDKTCTKVKVVDFGSGCLVNQQTYTYVQSRFYRSPEVLLRIPYTEKVDMWSLGCILAELFTGEPLFPGNNEQEQLEYIMEVKGIPSDSMIDKSRKKDHYFDTDYSPFLIEDDDYGILRIPENRRLRVAVPSADRMFINFLSRCLELDPEERMSAKEALSHPWITGDLAQAALLIDQNQYEYMDQEQVEAVQHNEDQMNQNVNQILYQGEGLEVIEQDNEEDEVAERGELEGHKQNSDSSANSNITASFVSGEPTTSKSNGMIVSASIRNAEEENPYQDQTDMLQPAILSNSASKQEGTIELIGVTKPFDF